MFSYIEPVSFNTFIYSLDYAFFINIPIFQQALLSHNKNAEQKKKFV